MSSDRLIRRISIAAAVIIAAAAAFFLVLRYSPYPAWDAFLGKPFSIVLTDRSGRELRVVPLDNGLRRMSAELSEYPDYLPEIFISSEDEHFYAHPGVDPAAIIRAAVQNRRAGRIVSGASTVSMQLAGLASGAGAPTIASKAREAFDALRIEARHSKKELLALWLSSLPFGKNAEGVSAASREYFGAEVSDLSVEQCLLLAVIPRRPQLYDPADNPEAAVGAALLLAGRAGIETDRAALFEAARGAVELAAAGGYDWRYEAPHFVNWVESELKRSGYEGRGVVRTSLDLEINDALHGAIASRVEKAARYRIGNGAGLIIDAENGEILGWIGSADFFDEKRSGQIDGVRIKRQPGSTLKPFLYSIALESGWSAASVLPDIPMSFGNEEVYIPQNYNQRFNGPVRLRTALSSSLNIPAVWLTEKIGVERFTETLAELGFRSIEEQRGSLGVGLALGNAEVELLELVRAYAVFPREGETVDLNFLCGDERDRGAERVFEKETAALIRSILSDNVNRVLGFGRLGLGVEGFDAMMKTGTSNQFNNIWAVGATPKIVCGIWMGNFSGETVIGSPGSGLPADAVIEVLESLNGGERFPPESGLVEAEICTLSGMRATDACPGRMTELFRPGEVPASCSWHGEEDGRVKTVYPEEYRRWSEIYGMDLETSAEDRSVRITRPADGAVFFYDSSMPDSAQAVSVDIEGRGFCRLRVNGEQAAEGQLPLRWMLPVRAGIYSIEAETASGVDEITVELR